MYVVAMQPGGQHVVTGGGDDNAYVWDPASGEVLLQLAGVRHPLHRQCALITCTFRAQGQCDMRVVQS